MPPSARWQTQTTATALARRAAPQPDGWPAPASFAAVNSSADRSAGVPIPRLRAHRHPGVPGHCRHRRQPARRPWARAQPRANSTRRPSVTVLAVAGSLLFLWCRSSATVCRAGHSAAPDAPGVIPGSGLAGVCLACHGGLGGLGGARYGPGPAQHHKGVGQDGSADRDQGA